MNADIDTLLTDESNIDDNDGDCVAENGPKSNSPLPSSFSAVALQLWQDANNDDNDEYTSGLGEVIEIEEDISHPAEGSRPQQTCCFFGQKRMFCIWDMFNWLVEVGWDEFWFQGVKNMESETLFYKLLSRLPEDEVSHTGGNAPGESLDMGSGPSSSNIPIVINDSDWPVPGSN
ncbi:uncharacterized protein BJ212DRAFT_1477018 [Suillus subaureus]|uniref:Uncharacterized protein n=1 Tax=Suillus subaureus TaxID=48587 RepID=A0A9P7JHF9_9AGAM|nr:uncharacterized protein BJ212DRAFT_1477018 [Suillus subaureus]KAG1822598.1 hypothetical protein BJ212DRAFT_1477018 [Suillus subaureus]